MRANKLFIAITSAAMLAVLPAAHAADTGGAATANQPVPYLDDAAITTKVKAKFLADKVVSGIKIKVETMQGIYQTYAYNRFQACRFGLAATFCDTASGKRPTLGEDFSNTVERLLPTAYELGTTESLLALRDRATQQLSDADWLRRQYRETASLSEVVRRQCEYWRSDTAPV